MLVYYKSNRNMILTDCSTVGTVWGGKELTMDDIRVTYDLLHCILGLFLPSSGRLPSLMLSPFLWALFIRIPLFRTRLHGLHMAPPFYSSRSRPASRVVRHSYSHRFT